MKRAASSLFFNILKDILNETFEKIRLCGRFSPHHVRVHFESAQRDEKIETTH